jgi:hypothetical protein
VDKIEVSLAEQKTISDGLAKQLDTANNSVVDLQKQFESQAGSMQQLEQDVAQKASEIK